MTSNLTIVGNLTKDPELRFTPTGQATSSFAVAVNRRWQNRQTNAWEEATSFFDVVAWGTLAGNLADSLRRGDRVVVEGRLDQRSWENNQGEKRSKLEITANEVAPSLRWATVEISKNQHSTPQTVPAGDSAGTTKRSPSNTPRELAPLNGERRQLFFAHSLDARRLRSRMTSGSGRPTSACPAPSGASRPALLHGHASMLIDLSAPTSSGSCDG